MFMGIDWLLSDYHNMAHVHHHVIHQACQCIWMFGQSLPHLALQLLCLLPQFLINVGQGGFGPENSMEWATFIGLAAPPPPSTFINSCMSS